MFIITRGSASRSVHIVILAKLTPRIPSSLQLLPVIKRKEGGPNLFLCLEKLSLFLSPRRSPSSSSTSSSPRDASLGRRQLRRKRRWLTRRFRKRRRKQVLFPPVPRFHLRFLVILFLIFLIQFCGCERSATLIVLSVIFVVVA